VLIALLQEISLISKTLLSRSRHKGQILCSLSYSKILPLQLKILGYLWTLNKGVWNQGAGGNTGTYMRGSKRRLKVTAQ
jgi:hypothetical protein